MASAQSSLSPNSHTSGGVKLTLDAITNLSLCMSVVAYHSGDPYSLLEDAFQGCHIPHVCPQHSTEWAILIVRLGDEHEGYGAGLSENNEVFCCPDPTALLAGFRTAAARAAGTGAIN